MGLPSSVVAGLAAVEPQDFEVWPVNLPVIDAWLASATQWCTAPLADGRVHWLGLNYAAVKAGLDMADMTVPPGVWARVQIMERAAAAALNGAAAGPDDA